MDWKILVMLNGLRLDGAEILVVSPTPTWPLDYGNRKRIFSICDALKKRGAIIHFLHYPSEGEWRDHYPKHATQVMQGQWDYYYKAAPSRPLHAESEHDDHSIDEWWDYALEKEIKWLSSVNSFDAIIVNYSWLSKALEFVPDRCLKVLDTHDRFSNRGELLEKNGIKKEFFHTTQSEEFKALVRADVVWAIKHEEEEFFQNLLHEHENEDTVVKTMLYVEDKEGFTFRNPYKSNQYLTVGMVGARNNINIINTKAFLTVALPIFEKYMVPVEVLLAGTMCKDLQDFEHPFVKQLGRVESLDDFYEQLDIALVPMTFSTGLKIKVGEALAYGVPLIAHKHAYEGYPVCHEAQAMESLEDIAMAIVSAAHNHQEIDDLREASEKAQQALHSEVSTTLDHFVVAIKEHRETAVIVLPKLCSGEYSLQKLKIDNVINNLNWKYRTILYYPFEVTPDIQVFLENKSDWEIIACQDDTIASNQIWSGVDLQIIHQTWEFDLLWNLSNQIIEKNSFEKNFCYFQDVSFNISTEQIVDSDCNVLVQATVENTFNDHKSLNWHSCPFPGTITDIRDGLWKGLPAEESQTVYMLMSGTKEQIHFWYEVYNRLFSDKYRLCWIIDSQEVDWHIENRLDPIEVANDYLILKEAARCGIMINIAKSNLIATLAWTLFVCGRRIFDIQEISGDKGIMELSTVYRETMQLLSELKIDNYENRFESNASNLSDIGEIYRKVKHQKLSLVL